MNNHHLQTQLITFDHPIFDSIRTLNDDHGNPLFVASDIAKALGYRNAPDMTRNIDPEDVSTRQVRSNQRGNPNKTVINESGLYAAIFASRLKAAKQFKRWITGTVLPALREHGAYVSGIEKLPKDIQRDLLVHLVDKTRQVERLFDKYTEGPRFAFMDPFKQDETKARIIESLQARTGLPKHLVAKIVREPDLA
jgi:anti-repressor protein